MGNYLPPLLKNLLTFLLYMLWKPFNFSMKTREAFCFPSWMSRVRVPLPALKHGARPRDDVKGVGKHHQHGNSPCHTSLTMALQILRWLESVFTFLKNATAKRMPRTFESRDLKTWWHYEIIFLLKYFLSHNPIPAPTIAPPIEQNTNGIVKNNINLNVL